MCGIICLGVRIGTLICLVYSHRLVFELVVYIARMGCSTICGYDQLKRTSEDRAVLISVSGLL